MNEQGRQGVRPDKIMQYAMGYGPPLLLEAAVRNGLFDALADGPQGIDAVASAAGTDPRATRIVLNALLGLEILTRDDHGRYGLTDVAAKFLVSTRPESLAGLFGHVSKHLIPSWLQLGEILRTGAPTQKVNDESTGASFFNEFVEDLYPLNMPSARALAEHLNLAARGGEVKVLDLAAGSGVWGIALAKQAQGVHVTAVDWEGVLDVTRHVTRKHGLESRFRFFGGDLLNVEFGTDYHVATLGHILHSEGAERSRRLINKTFDALAPGGVIAIAEWLVKEDRSGPPQSLMFAVTMLVNTKTGDTYSFGEIRSWLEAAGFTNARLLDTPSQSPLVLADKPV